MKQSHSHPWAQQWAIIRRSFIALRRRPISSLIRVLLLPVIVIGAIFYGVKDLDQNSALNASLVLHIKLLAMSITIFNVFASTNTLVTDKATGMKALMMSMGLNRVNYYCAMGISFLIIVLPPTLLIAIISKVYVLDNTVSHLTILGLFILFTIQLDAVSAAGVSFVTSTNYVFLVIFPIALGDILFDTLIHKLIGLIGDSSTPIMLFFASSSPYAVLKYFFNDYAKSHGIPDETEQNLTQPAYLLLIAQLFWIIFFRLFAYWFEEVCPWQTFTSPRHFFYCLERRKSKNDDDEESIESAVSGSRLKYFEQRSSNTADIGIQVRNIRKTFGQQVALNNVSFAIYKGETTLLLGHNGAGKSTLMQIILGQLEPDDGYVRIKNYFGDVSPAIGVCPQTSILDDDLSVKQHLELFNDIKSKISGNERVRHVNQTIVDVSLAGHESKQPQELSGGMKRKLSLGIAFVGKSNVLILDEPSSGLDPDSRMFVWNAIRRYRSDRTVLLSTQHMEEADYLGDRIAIMSAGRIVCCGSSVYLNKQFGTGYKLRIECRSSRWEEILDYIRYYFDTVQPTEASTNPPLHTDADPIVDLVLELKTNDTNKDPELELIRLLEDLENNAESLSIRSYGLKSSSIEDVMVNTSEYFSPPIESNEPASSKAEQLETITSTRSNVVLLIDLLWALIIKHLQVHKANRLTVLLQKLILPTLGIYILTWNLSSSKIDGLWQDPKVALMVAHLMYFPSRDYASKFKIIQLNSNANVCIYWLAQAMIDLLWLVVPIIALNYSIWKWQYAPVIETWQLHCLVSLALTGLYLASMLACYCLSFAINPKFAISSLYLISAGSSIISLLIFLVSLLIFRSGGSLPLTILAYIGILVCPTDAFAYIFIGLRSKCYIMIANNSSICQLEPGPSPVLVGFLALLFQIALYSSLLFLIEFRSIDVEWYCRLQNILPCFNRATKLTTNESREMDRDVVEETEKALVAIKNVNGPHSLVAALLNKSYIKYNKVIEDLSFTMKRGECFGLLGVNGAGKTTTFSMLATEIAPDSGRILANGNYSDQNQRTYRKGLGYDPQTTPELSLTPYQALSLMARLRSIDRSSLHQVVVAVLDLLEMSQHAHKYDMQLSGGTRRKLALGMALIGNPSILALDEPTAGVDPLARRSVWQLLKSLRAHNSSSIIISSHAMEECEAICDRIAIMARGRLRCIGTFLHLRSKFARGCTLRVQSTTDTIVEQLEQQLTEAIGSSVFSLADRNVHSVTFNITDNRVRRSILFRMMREFRLKHPNISYMINDSSLEDVFITLAREQENFDKQLGRAG